MRILLVLMETYPSGGFMVAVETRIRGVRGIRLRKEMGDLYGENRE